MNTSPSSPDKNLPTSVSSSQPKSQSDFKKVVSRYSNISEWFPNSPDSEQTQPVVKEPMAVTGGTQMDTEVEGNEFFFDTEQPTRLYSTFVESDINSSDEDENMFDEDYGTYTQTCFRKK